MRLRARAARWGNGACDLLAAGIVGVVFWLYGRDDRLEPGCCDDTCDEEHP